jgi:hypothetical protein
MGTPHYMSPEHCLGEELDHRSDIYSLGVVLYEMLAGVVPFNSPTSTAIVVQHVSGSPAPLRVLNVSIPQAVEAVVMRALAKKREERPQSAGALAQELAAASAATSGAFASVPQSSGFATVSQVGTGGFLPTVAIPTPQHITPAGVMPSTAPLAPSTSVASRNRWWMIAAAAVAGVLVAGSGLAWMLLKPEPPIAEASLSIRTIAQTSILLDGQEVGVTNAEGFLNLTQLKPGPHVVTIRKDGYEQQQRTVTLAENRTELVEAPLQLSAAVAPAPIEPASVPTAAPVPVSPPPAPPPPPPASEASLVVYAGAGSSVLIDGQQAGVTSSSGYLNVPKLRPGQHLVVVTKSGHRDEQRTLTLAAGRNEILRVDLVPLPGKLNVTANPNDAEILVDNRRHTGRIQGLELRPGRYAVRVSKAGFVTANREVEILPGDSEDLTLSLERVSPSDLLADADRRLKSGNFAEAAAISRSLLETDADNPAANLLLGQALYNTGSHADSTRYLSRALALGAEVALPVSHHHGGFPNEAVCSGILTIRKDNLSFHSTTAGGHDFSVPLAKFYQLKNEPQKEKRVNVNVGVPRGAKEDKRDYNFHHPDARAVPPNETSSILVVRCPGCDDRMYVVFSLLQGLKRF